MPAASCNRLANASGPGSEPAWAAIERALAAREPCAAFERLRSDGFVARQLPELEALFGVPQPARSHPEIDAGLHSLMALEQAARLSPLPEVRFGALLHDVGKGMTPRSEWPRHKGHERRGVPIIDALCARLGAPRSFRETAMRAAGCHGLAHKAAELPAATLLDLLEEWGPVEDPEGIERLVVIGWADKRGRAGAEAVDYPPARVLREARAVVAAVPEDPLSSLRQRRLEALARLRAAADQPAACAAVPQGRRRRGSSGADR